MSYLPVGFLQIFAETWMFILKNDIPKKLVWVLFFSVEHLDR
jgi:hypothetical protein